MEKKMRQLDEKEKEIYMKRKEALEGNIKILETEINVLIFKLEKELPHETQKQADGFKKQIKQANAQLNEQKFTYGVVTKHLTEGVEIKEEPRIVEKNEPEIKQSFSGVKIEEKEEK